MIRDSTSSETQGLEPNTDWVGLWTVSLEERVMCALSEKKNLMVWQTEG
jgi:hypothetical protein